MRDTRVEEVEHISSDSDSDEMAGGATGSDSGRASQELTIGIFPNHVQQGITIIILYCYVFSPTANPQILASSKDSRTIFQPVHNFL